MSSAILFMESGNNKCRAIDECDFCEFHLLEKVDCDAIGSNVLYLVYEMPSSYY